MARHKSEQLTPLELEIMHVLWETGPANVQTVQQHLERQLAYTTVQTMLNILQRKGKAKRTLKDRAYFYKPAVSRSQVVGQHMSDIVERLFGGSAARYRHALWVAALGLSFVLPLAGPVRQIRTYVAGPSQPAAIATAP